MTIDSPGSALCWLLGALVIMILALLGTLVIIKALEHLEGRRVPHLVVVGVLSLIAWALVIMIAFGAWALSVAAP